MKPNLISGSLDLRCQIKLNRSKVKVCKGKSSIVSEASVQVIEFETTSSVIHVGDQLHACRTEERRSSGPSGPRDAFLLKRS